MNFSRFFGVCGLLSSLAFVAVAEQETLPETASYELAEQFIHGQIYNGMVLVWNTDRQAWNKLLQVHACGGTDSQAKLEASYALAQPLFSQAIRQLAAGQSDFDFAGQEATLDQVAELAYRLFSASYAHGYARQIQRADSLSPGIQEEMCGMSEPAIPPSAVRYSNLEQGEEAGESFGWHVNQGFAAFQTLLNGQYDKFEALIYSHAYQDTEAYNHLFFEVNGFDNLLRYQQLVEQLATSGQASIAQADKFIADIGDDVEVMPHADFAYLVLSSGYHWGTISVLAMLEEEYPRLHLKAREHAIAHIRHTLDKDSADSQGAAGH